MKTIFQKNTRWISGTSYPGILTIKKNRDVDNTKAQFRILDTWLEEHLHYQRAYWDHLLYSHPLENSCANAGKKLAASNLLSLFHPAASEQRITIHPYFSGIFHGIVTIEKFNQF
jgi:hypothetical protein